MTLRGGNIGDAADGAVSRNRVTVGPDGNLYVSNYGFGLPPNGSGQILKITLHSEV